MKIEYRRAIQKAIVDQPDQTGHTWEITADGMRWSYGVLFNFHLDRFADGEAVLTVKEDGCTATSLVSIMIGPTRWDDTNDVEKAYYMAARAAIIQANYLY